MIIQYFPAIQGAANRCNNLIYVSNSKKKSILDTVWSVVCFFGGDIQNFHDEMIRSNHQYIDYSLENVAKKLYHRFIYDDILVIQPCKTINSFSIYENFVKSIDNLGTPFFDCQDTTCYIHLIGLLKNLAKDVKRDPNYGIEIKLVAFSKGQVVINQLARSLKYVECEKEKIKFKEIYLLDGGHNGYRDFWITDLHLIDCLINKGGCRKIHVGVTDFQLMKSKRISEEEKEFQRILAEKSESTLSTKRIHLYQHDYKHLTPIQLHFKILDYFFEGDL